MIPRLLSAPLRRKPDFLIIGAPKGGTSSLYEYLVQHPDIAPAIEKELQYFTFSHGRGQLWYRAHFPSLLGPVARRLRGAPPQLTGEATPYYLSHPRVPELVARELPDAKLIVLLRNPVDRAYSHFHHNARQGWESNSFEEALDKEEERLAGEADRLRADPHYYSQAHHLYGYKTWSMYADQLEAWLARFPCEQLLVMNSEDFFHDTERVFLRVLSFLGANPWAGCTFKPHNAGRYDGMAADTRAELRRIFAPSNQRLAVLLGRELPW